MAILNSDFTPSTESLRYGNRYSYRFAFEALLIRVAKQNTDSRRKKQKTAA